MAVSEYVGIEGATERLRQLIPRGDSPGLIRQGSVNPDFFILGTLFGVTVLGLKKSNCGISPRNRRTLLGFPFPFGIQIWVLFFCGGNFHTCGTSAPFSHLNLLLFSFLLNVLRLVVPLSCPDPGVAASFACSDKSTLSDRFRRVFLYSVGFRDKRGVLQRVWTRFSAAQGLLSGGR